MCVFKTQEESHAICNALVPGNKNISLIELFNCPLNPAERPCCCLMACVCVCVCFACVRMCPICFCSFAKCARVCVCVCLHESGNRRKGDCVRAIHDGPGASFQFF